MLFHPSWPGTIEVKIIGVDGVEEVVVATKGIRVSAGSPRLFRSTATLSRDLISVAVS
jgi:hypothetical protein